MDMNSFHRIGWTGIRGLTFCTFCALIYFAWIILRNGSDDVGASNTNSRSFTVVEDCALEDRMDQYDPCLIEYALKNVLLPPSGEPLEPTSVNTPAAADKKLAFIKKHLIDKGSSSPGFFVQCGTNSDDGQSLTLELERNYKWTGLLIEPNMELFQNLVKSYRNVWLANVALCITVHSDVVPFYNRGAQSKLIQDSSPFLMMDKRSKKEAQITDIPCLPIYPLLAALNKTSVDYFSLSTKDSDKDIMSTVVPFQNVTFNLVIMENHDNQTVKENVVSYMTGKSYKFLGTLAQEDNKFDIVFVHDSFYKKEMHDDVESPSS